jgi:hypothetical protein
MQYMLEKALRKNAFPAKKDARNPDNSRKRVSWMNGDGIRKAISREMNEEISTPRKMLRLST